MAFAQLPSISLGPGQESSLWILLLTRHNPTFQLIISHLTPSSVVFLFFRGVIFNICEFAFGEWKLQRLFCCIYEKYVFAKISVFKMFLHKDRPFAESCCLHFVVSAKLLTFSGALGTSRWVTIFYVGLSTQD